MSVLVGNLVKVQATFQDEHGDVQDPATVQVRVKNPDTTTDTYIYGTDPEVVRVSKGVYYIEIDTTGQDGGTYQIVWNSSGTYQAAGQTYFQVSDTLF